VIDLATSEEDIHVDESKIDLSKVEALQIEEF